MNQTAFMEFLKTLDHVEYLDDGGGRVERAGFFHQGLKRGAGHQLHDDVRNAPIVIDGQHEDAPGMRHGAGQLALLAKPLDSL